VQEAVSDILVERARDTEGISRMVVVSIFAHAVLLALVVVMPSQWLRSDIAPENTMMISLGGAPGPDTGGMTQISGRTVQTVAPPVAKPVAEPTPATKPPEMVAPTPAKTPPRASVKPVEKPAERSTSRTPTSGAEVKTGAAKVDTGAAPVPFGGLSSAGGGAGGATTDYANFCCPAYLRQMSDMIRRNWVKNQGATGKTQVKFVIRRDGMLTGIEIEQPSGQALLDQASLRALLLTKQVPPLPREFPENNLTVHLIFEYTR
jgi:TonB family protein